MVKTQQQKIPPKQTLPPYPKQIFKPHYLITSDDSLEHLNRTKQVDLVLSESI